MTVQPIRTQFQPLISGNVRTADLVGSIAKDIDRILDVGTAANNSLGPTRELQFRALASKLRRLAETIEKGEK